MTTRAVPSAPNPPPDEPVVAGNPDLARGTDPDAVSEVPAGSGAAAQPAMPGDAADGPAPGTAPPPLPPHPGLVSIRSPPSPELVDAPRAEESASQPPTINVTAASAVVSALAAIVAAPICNQPSLAVPISTPRCASVTFCA